MERKYIGIMFILLLSLSFISAESFEQNFSSNKMLDVSSIQVDSLKYDPYPVNPGEYFNLWILVQKTGTDSKGATFELTPSYPFSLDSNEEATRTFASMPGESALLEYRVRVDKDAVEGINQIALQYKMGGSTGWISKDFDIYVSDAQTSFDGVIQEVSGSTVSLAIANTGKNIANSVIVKIPTQAGFQAIGTSGQMVGNLNNGDYTIVTFDLKQIERGDQTIRFQVDYTDAINERRTVNLDIPLNLQSGQSLAANQTFAGSSPYARTGAKPVQSSSGKALWYVIGGIILVILIIKRKKIFGKLSKCKKESKH